MKLFLVDLNEELVAAWHKSFESIDSVSVLRGNILDVALDTIVSPANSYGYMDGGIDRAYRSHFGIQIEQDLQALIAQRDEKYLPVGESIVVKTGHSKIVRMIAAPTMFVPEPIPGKNVRLAMKSALRSAFSVPDIENLFCPGMGTGIGRVPPEEAAWQMRAAFDEIASTIP